MPSFKRLQQVNLIPVIAKADTLTDDEIISFKKRILRDIEYHQIQIFEPPRYELDDDETIQENREIMSKMPFAIVGSNTAVKTKDGRIVRAREYPWGIIEVDNEEHCDFVKLRQMLIRYIFLSVPAYFYFCRFYPRRVFPCVRWIMIDCRTHMEELKEKTSDVLYENYRSDKLMSMGVEQDQTVFKEVNPAVKQEEERQLHQAKLAKMEHEMKLGNPPLSPSHMHRDLMVSFPTKSSGEGTEIEAERGGIICST